MTVDSDRKPAAGARSYSDYRASGPSKASRLRAHVRICGHKMGMTMAYTIKVNAVDHSADVDGDMPLLWVLRDVLGMTGTKFGCGMALCGACTVHIDGQPIRSCVTPVDQLSARAAITTIEAIGDDAGRQEDSESLARRWRCRSAAIASRARSCPLRAAGEQPKSQRCRHRRRDGGQHLPLRHLSAGSAPPSSRLRSPPAPMDREAEHVHRSGRCGSR